MSEQPCFTTQQSVYIVCQRYRVVDLHGIATFRIMLVFDLKLLDPLEDNYWLLRLSDSI